MKEAVIRLSAFDIGCLAVTNSANEVVVVLSESDHYIKRVAASLGRNIQYTGTKPVCTYEPNTCTIHCYRQEDGKDLTKEISQENSATIARYSDFKIG